MNRISTNGAAALVLAWAGCSYAFAQLDAFRVITTSDPVPGLGPQSRYEFTQIGPKFAPNAGQFCMGVSATRPGIGKRKYVVLGGSIEVPQLVYWNANDLPDAGPGVFASNSGDNPFGVMSVNSTGKVVFGASLGGTGVNQTNDYGTWYGDAGDLHLLAREGMQAPGTSSGVQFAQLGSTVTSDANVVAFNGQLTGPGVTQNNAWGFWYGTPGAVSLLVRESDPAPDRPQGETIVATVGELSINSAGTVAIRARAKGATLRDAIWTGTPGNLRIAAISGQAAVNRPSETLTGIHTPPTLNEHDDAAFLGDLSVSSSHRSALVSGPTGLRVLLAPNDPVPGFSTGNVFKEVYSLSGSAYPIPFNRQGIAVVKSLMVGPDMGGLGSTGLVMTDGVFTRLIARTGGQAPGLPEGTTFNAFDTCCMNNLGQLAFMARTGPADYDLWAFDGSKVFRVLTNGDKLRIGPGDVRTVLDFDSSAYGVNGSTEGSGLDDHGRIFLRVWFTDGSAGQFVIAIPSPGIPASILSIAGILAISRRRP